MVQIKEFRVVMPMSLEEYQVAQSYMVSKMQQQSTTDTEGVDILESKPFEDDEFGKGHYTSKVYRLQSKAPSWLTTFAPADALILQEEAWNAYPRCKTVIKCPYFTKFSLTVETVHKSDNGHSENVHCLNKDQLAAREVEIIDIASAATDYWSYIIGTSTVDFSKFKSMKAERGPLLEGWQDQCNPVMTAYKLVTIDAPYWGFSYRLEQAMLAPSLSWDKLYSICPVDHGSNIMFKFWGIWYMWRHVGALKQREYLFMPGERALFIESHRNCFSWIDEWFGMTLQQVRELETQDNFLSGEDIGRTVSMKNGNKLDLGFAVDDEDVYNVRPRLTSERQQPLPLDTRVVN